VVVAIEGVNLAVRDGEVVGLVGESGSGKTVTSLSVLRLYDEKRLVRYGGRVLYRGIDLLSLTEREMRRCRGAEIGLVCQDALGALNPVRSIQSQLTEVLSLHRGLRGAAARAEALALLDLVGIPEAARRLLQLPHELSGGMRQRVCIALALAARPRLLIADEPTTALDATIQAQILVLLIGLNQRLGMALILITHDLAVAKGRCTRVAVMHRGRIVEDAPTAVLFAQPQHDYTQRLLGAMVL
jgi:ABC-type dipeptide/oligopeptide/nickel transport system ATPase component